MSDIEHQLSPVVVQYLSELDAMCAQSSLTPPQARITFLYRIYAQICRFENNYVKRGRIDTFNALEIAALLEELEDRISQTKAQVNAAENP